MPKTLENLEKPRESVILERSVEKIIMRRATVSEQNAPDRRLSELYQELKKTAAETGTSSQQSYKLVYVNNDVDSLRMARQCFRQYTDEQRKRVMADLEAERNRKFEEVQKLENISNLGKEVLSNISSMRKHTETVMLQTLNRCRSLCEQIGQPATRVEDISVMESTINSMVQDLQP